MAKDPTIAIRDCLAEIAILHDIAARTTLTTFQSDPIMRRAAAYAIQTVSEAVRRLPDEVAGGLPDGAMGADQGRRQPHIRHEYFRLDDVLLWEIVTLDSHTLKAVLEAMLAQHGGERQGEVP